MKQVIAVDFDGTIHNSKSSTGCVIVGQAFGAPFDGALEALSRLRMRGFKIIVFSVRGLDPKLKHWMDIYQLPYDEITNIKPNADVFIDDCALRFEGSWEDTMKKVLTLIHDDALR